MNKKPTIPEAVRLERMREMRKALRGAPKVPKSTSQSESSPTTERQATERQTEIQRRAVMVRLHTIICRDKQLGGIAPPTYPYMKGAKGIRIWDDMSCRFYFITVTPGEGSPEEEEES